MEGRKGKRGRAQLSKVLTTVVIIQQRPQRRSHLGGRGFELRVQARVHEGVERGRDDVPVPVPMARRRVGAGTLGGDRLARGMRLVHGVEAIRDLAEREVVDVATHVEGLPAPADGEPTTTTDLVLVGRRVRGGVDYAPATHAQRDLGLGHDERVGRGLDTLEQQAKHEERREAARPLGARARLQRGPERREERLRLLEQELVQRRLDLAVEDARRRERRVRVRVRQQEGEPFRVRLLEAAQMRQR